jgi:hypothetical protein
MNTPNNRQELLEAIAELGNRFPNWRLGQLVANLATSAGKLESSAIWDLEDEAALMAARRLLESREPSTIR